MNRYSFLIDGGRVPQQSILRGTANDINNFTNFLRSNAGGAWKFPEEIERFSVNLYDLNYLMDKIGGLRIKVPSLDYLLLYFTGHGRRVDGIDEIAVSGGTLQIPDIINKISQVVPKASVIFDICRIESVIELPTISHVIKEASAEIDEDASRLRFENAIQLAAQGITTCYSCCKGERSLIMPNGSLFTTVLLNYGYEWVNQQFGSEAKSLVSAIRDTVSGEVYANSLTQGITQTPEASGPYLPFAVSRKAVV
jgi:hypothetical protein